MVEKVLEIAAAEVGYLEKKSNASLDDKTANAGSANYTKYARDYAAWGWGNYQAQPWCDMFVSWAFKKAGCDDSVAGHSAYCPSHVNWFRARGRWGAGLPLAGDVIFFKDSGGVACHVGLVEKVDGARVYTVEGNTSSAAGVIANGGAVARKSYPLDYAWILGYGRPDYKEEDTLMGKEYEELKKTIQDLAAKIPAPPMIYAWVDDNMPEWAKPTVQKLMDAGYLKGDEQGRLNLDDNMLRILIMLDRAGAFSVK